MYGIVSVSPNRPSNHEKKIQISARPFLHDLGCDANEVLGWRIEIRGAITPTRPGLLCMVAMKQSVGDRFQILVAYLTKSNSI